MEQQLELLDKITRDIAEERQHKRARNLKRSPKASVLLGLKKLGDFE